MRIISFITLICVFLLPTLVGAEQIDLNQVVATLELPFQATSQRGSKSGSAGIYDFQAEFSQESQIVSLDRVQRGQGQVSFKFLRTSGKPAPVVKFRWEYLQPTPQEIVSDGRTLWVYVPENRQVIESDISHISQQQGENPVTFLSGLGNLSRDFNIRWGDPRNDEAGNYLLELEPKRESQMIRTLRIVVARAAVADYVKNHRTGKVFPILATEVIDPNGNQTTIRFHNPRVNADLAEVLFTFDKPAGVEVVRPTGEELHN